MIPAIKARNLKVPRRRQLELGCLLLLASIAIMPAWPAVADDAAPGMFLIATRDLKGSTFAESVVLLIQHDENGTMGIIINQPTNLELTSILPEISPNVVSRIYLGGPVATYGIMLLIRSTEELIDAEHVFGNVYASGDRELLVDLLDKEDATNSIRLYAGHAGWFPGQLDYEIRRGSWRVVPANESMIFTDEPLEIWRQLVPPADPILVRYEIDENGDSVALVYQ